MNIICPKCPGDFERIHLDDGTRAFRCKRCGTKYKLVPIE